MNHLLPQRPWFREPMVWLVISLPLSAVIGGFWTLWLAISSADGMVVDDYYREGLAINRELARDERASALGLTASVQLTPDSIRIQLSAPEVSDLPPVLKVAVLNATRAGLDRHLELGAIEPGRYAASLAPLPAGHWRVHLEAADWRLMTSARTP